MNESSQNTDSVLVPATNTPLSKEPEIVLKKMEAEWVSQELAEFVKLTQQYRILYITAVFVALGWVLGQLLSAQNVDLLVMRKRADIAVILCFVPLVNILFALLMLEAMAQMQSLARYRYVLGIELGEQIPIWRWEIWKSGSQGSIRLWTAPLNIFFSFFICILSIGSLWFAYPAIEIRPFDGLTVLWLISLLAFIALLPISIKVGWQYRKRNNVTAPLTPQEEWKYLITNYQVSASEEASEDLTPEEPQE